MMWIVLWRMLAKRAAKSSARRAVSPPSNATAHALIGDGRAPHTITQRSALLISDAAVAPSSAPWVWIPRRPTSTASVSFARAASSVSGSPSRSTTSACSPAARTRSAARPSSTAPASAALARSATWPTTSVALNRSPSTIACSSAASALGLPSSPIRKRVNTGLREHREGLQVPQAEREHLAGHGEASRKDFVPPVRLESLGHHHIFGAPPPQRYPAPLPHRPLQCVERVGAQGAVLGDLGHGSSTDLDRARGSGGHPADARGRRSAFLLQGRHQRIGAIGRHREQQPAGCLRVA